VVEAAGVDIVELTGVDGCSREKRETETGEELKVGIASLYVRYVYILSRAAISAVGLM